LPAGRPKEFAIFATLPLLLDRVVTFLSLLRFSSTRYPLATICHILAFFDSLLDYHDYLTHCYGVGQGHAVGES
jgi:hypothetical protein